MALHDNLKKLDNEKNVKFKTALKIAKEHFGDCRIKGSHHIFKMPWLGDPRINLQPSEKDKKMAKPCQVRELVKALKRIEHGEN